MNENIKNISVEDYVSRREIYNQAFDNVNNDLEKLLNRRINIFHIERIPKVAIVKILNIEDYEDYIHKDFIKIKYIYSYETKYVDDPKDYEGWSTIKGNFYDEANVIIDPIAFMCNSYEETYERLIELFKYELLQKYNEDLEYELKEVKRIENIINILSK